MSGYVILVPLWSIVFPGFRKHSVKRASGIETRLAPSHFKPLPRPAGSREMPGERRGFGRGRAAVRVVVREAEPAAR